MTEKSKPTRARRTTKKKASSRAATPTNSEGAVESSKATDEKQATLSEATINLKELKTRRISDLNKLARELGVEGFSSMRKQDLIFSLLQAQSEAGGIIYGEGVLETLPDGLVSLELLIITIFQVPMIFTFLLHR